MFFVIYQFEIKTDKEEQFISNWAKMTEFFVEKCGGFGSKLHKDKNGFFIAYAKWPDEITWANAKNFPPEIKAISQLMKDCYLDGTSVKVIYQLTCVKDMLV